MAPLNHSSLAIITIIFCFFFITNSVDGGGGFTVNLFHRDSPSSPFHNPQLTPYQRLRNAVKRSINRLRSTSPTQVNTTLAAQSELIANHGEYLITIFIGTPPFEILAIADTGSDITWTQCKPCTNCYTQKGPTFDPASSTTYKTLPCSSHGVVSGNGVVSTPLIHDAERPYYYYLRLEAVTVGTVRMSFRGSNGNNNIVIDSGTTFTVFPTGFFNEFSTIVESQVVGAKKAVDPEGFFSLCYESKIAILNAPRITVHFEGADVELSVSNVFVQVSDTLTCLAFRGSDGDSFYGNVAQEDFLIGYDLQQKRVSFKPTDCAHS
ncbi:Aspartic proteinase CDR1 [Linum perenne]